MEEIDFDCCAACLLHVLYTIKDNVIPRLRVSSVERKLIAKEFLSMCTMPGCDEPIQEHIIVDNNLKSDCIDHSSYADILQAMNDLMLFTSEPSEVWQHEDEGLILEFIAPCSHGRSMYGWKQFFLANTCTECQSCILHNKAYYTIHDNYTIPKIPSNANSKQKIIIEQ